MLEVITTQSTAVARTMKMEVKVSMWVFQRDNSVTGKFAGTGSRCPFVWRLVCMISDSASSRKYPAARDISVHFSGPAYRSSRPWRTATPS